MLFQNCVADNGINATGNVTIKLENNTSPPIASTISIPNAAKPSISIDNLNISNEMISIKTLDGLTLSAMKKDHIAAIKKYEPAVGDRISYEIKINNNGSNNNSMKDAYLIDILPENMSFILSTKNANRVIPSAGARDREIIWSLHMINGSEFLSINLTATVIDLPADIYDNTVYVRGTWETQFAYISEKSGEVTAKEPT
jgi:uncharacterized repeat protein (TIGR01451 family)